MLKKDLKKIKNYLYEIPKSYRHDMRVCGRVYADNNMLDDILEDRSLEQVVNVAALPGIVGYSLAMPDVHQGYGMPVGGVAAFDAEQDGIISPGSVGYDINCGVRLLKSNYTYKDIKEKLPDLATQIQRDVPSGLGRGVETKLSVLELDNILEKGARWAVEEGYGKEEDLEYIEAKGCMEHAQPSLCSDRAKKRGSDQVGTLGSGNHFLEIQRVEKIFEKDTAKKFGLYEDQITFMIHTGSRGFGHQVATDYIKMMMAVMQKYNIIIPDRELACTPFNSEEGQEYFKAMACAMNFAWANRQVIMHRVRKAVKRIIDEDSLNLLYDIGHNTAKIEEYGGRKLCVHRKGATRAFGPGSEDIPEGYRRVGQPVLIPGSMGTASYVLAGTKEAEEQTFGSTCHGAGRVMSRSKAKREVVGSELRRELEERGIVIRCTSNRGLAEEAPRAYKDIDNVVEIVSKANISRKVARLVPLAVVKG